jgi:formylglycine-generating enzyme required for sulfatase activity
VGTDYTQDFKIPVNLQMTRTINGVSVPFRSVPAGTFQRDSTATNITIITNGYWMGETEVTQKLFLEVMGVNPSSFTSGAEVGEDQNKRPVEQVTWYEAIAFCNKLSIVDGKEMVYSVSGINWASLAYSAIPTSYDTTWNAATMDTGKNGYRLPTEMEWMWAAMGADTVNPGQLNTTGYDKAFAGSSESNSVGGYAWYSGNSGSKTHEVGKKAANELGLYDMSGNVFEWCWDWYGNYPSGNQTNNAGTASSPNRVIRGGRWSDNAPLCTVAYRNVNNPNGKLNSIGLRVMCRQ